MYGPALHGPVSGSAENKPSPTAVYNSSNQVTNNLYQYDGAGNVLYDGGRYYAYDANGAPALHFQLADHLGTRRMQTTVSDAATATTFYMGDQLGSTRLLMAGGGWPISADTYYPFGLEQAPTPDQNSYKFADLDRDSESGFDHATFRTLADLQGRWSSPDPYDFANPQSFNRYAYVTNEPANAVDPSGLFTLSPPPPTTGDCNLECDILTLGVGALIGEIGNLFGFSGPNFHGSLESRPNAGGAIWNDKFTVPYPGLGGSIAQALGLPDAGCEFGACGGSFLNQTPINENKTLQQKIAELAAAGVFVGPFETKHSPFHPGQITLRDNNWFCSQHVALDQGSGSGGHPVTGESHYDLVNPWRLTPVTTYWHTILDLVPDKIQDRFPGFPTGSDLCK